jgi:4-hydroxy-2-oxoheptanedioate aldolase
VGAGFMNIKLADVRSAKDVRDAISLIRSEAVGGLHGWTHGRNTINIGPQEWIDGMNDVGVIVVIEKKTAYDDFDEILSIEGLDMVTLGPADFSISLGRPGQPGKYFQHPEIKVIERDMIKRCNAKGVGYRAHPNTPDEVKEYLDLGVRNFSIGMDLDYIYHESKKNGEAMRKLLEAVG